MPGILVLWMGLVLLGASVATAQSPAPPLTDRPSERPLTPPEPREASPRRPVEVDAASEPDEARDGAPGDEEAGETQWVDALDLRGNVVLDDATLVAAVRPMLGRHLSAAQLGRLANRLTQVYIDRGYVNSGVHLPLQEVRDGVLVVEVTEGRLGEVVVEGARYFRASVLEARLRFAVRRPLNVAQIEEELRRLEADRRIRRLDARLRPTAERGMARLILRIEEGVPSWAEAEGNNYEPASVGTLAGTAMIGHDNLLGLGDRIWASGGATEGLRRFASGYTLPFHPSGTSVGFEARWSRAEIVQPPFDDLDVESEAYGVAARLMQPVLRDAESEVSVGLIAEFRKGQTSIAGRGRTFTPGADEGRTQLVLLRPVIEWNVRRSGFAVALRSIFSFGLDVPGATRNGGAIPDARFFSWLGQGRGVYRHAQTGLELHARLDAQLSDDALLPLEQIAVGGPGSVRGYPRNFLVRDQALIASLELQWPLWKRSQGESLLNAGPFVDFGRAWNRDRVTPGIRSLTSVGLHLLFRPTAGIGIDLEWAWPIRDVEAGDSLQSRGLAMRLRWSFP